MIISDGSPENDNIKGGKGDDVLVGGGGDDNIKGGKGDDVIYGDEGRDTDGTGGGDDDDDDDDDDGLDEEGLMIVPLDISASLADVDESESLSVVISGVPEGALLSAGSEGDDGSWTLTSDQLSGL